MAVKKTTVQSLQQNNRGGIVEPTSLAVQSYTPTELDLLPVVGPLTRTGSAFGVSSTSSVDVTGLSMKNKAEIATFLDQRNAAQIADQLNRQRSTADDVVVTAKRLDDYRVRIQPISIEKVLGKVSDRNSILYPLFATNGVLFPYTPSIQFSQDVDWKGSDLTHTNYETASYSRTPAVSLSLTGKFTVQTHEEGRYLLAVLHFFRVVSKMRFGREDAAAGKAGLPPPILQFSGYGPYMFNAVRVVVKNHSYTLDDAVNMTKVRTATGDLVNLPSVMMLSVSLMAVQSPARQKDDFNLDRFRTGDLMRNSQGGWL